MTVNVKFIGALRHISGAEELILHNMKDATISELIDQITKEALELRRSLIDEQLEDPKPNALILVNGKEISVLNGLETTLKDGDEVVFIPIVHGG